GAFDVAELALPAVIRDVGHRLGTERLHTFGPPRVDLSIDGAKEERKRAAVADAHSALVADLKCAAQLRLQISRVPEPGRARVPFGGSGGLSGRYVAHRTLSK